MLETVLDAAFLVGQRPRPLVEAASEALARPVLGMYEGKQNDPIVLLLRDDLLLDPEQKVE